MQETQVQSLGRENPLEKEMATHSSILAWEIPWVEEPGGLQFMGRENPLEKEMVTHSSTLAWRIPWMKKPGRLQSMGSQRVGHD